MHRNAAKLTVGGRPGIWLGVDAVRAAGETQPVSLGASGPLPENVAEIPSEPKN